MEAVIEAGLRIPEDIAIIGCGNANYARMLRVPLSSIDQNSEGLGESAAILAVELARVGSSARPRSILVPPTLVARASTMGQLTCD
jgi:LacI family transcriptional regulator